MAPKAKAAQVPPRSAPAERPGKKPWPPKVPMGATEDAGMRLCYWLISRVLASCMPVVPDFYVQKLMY